MKKAVLATAHWILRIAYSIIRNGTEYVERGGDCFDRLNPERTVRKLVRRLEWIGVEVEIRQGRAADHRAQRTVQSRKIQTE